MNHVENAEYCPRDVFMALLSEYPSCPEMMPHQAIAAHNCKEDATHREVTSELDSSVHQKGVDSTFSL